MRYLFSLILTVAWIAGIVIAHGFWQTTFSIVPFYSYYLVIEKVLLHYKLI